MNFSVIDTGGYLLAVLAGGLVLVAPGFALARFSGLAGRAAGPNPSPLLTGVVVGLAVLPAIDSVVIRFCGLDAALVVTLALAFAGFVLAFRDTGRVRTSAVELVLVGGWILLVGVEWIDFDVAGKLYQPLTIFDSVKHAATTQAIYDSGAPPRDAFFLRPERASYYYFFYAPAAVAMRLFGGLFDAKAAVGGLVFWTGIGVYGLIRLVMDRLGIVIAERRRSLLIVAVLAAGGLDILAVFYFAWSRSYWIADPLQWTDYQAGAWFEDVLWVPHHVTALVAGTIGLVALCDAMGDVGGSRSPRVAAFRAVPLAGIAFAASLGLSVWVTLGFVVTVAVWSLILLVERRWRALGLVLLAGGVALLVAMPQVVDLRAGRAGGGPVPIAVSLRGFTPVDLTVSDASLRLALDILALPLNYAIEFGMLALGSLLYWRRCRREGGKSGEFARVLTIAAISGLVIASLLRSTLFNNDLGWRVLLLPLLAGTVWTIAAMDRLRAVNAVPRSAFRMQGAAGLAVLFGLGWATVLYTAVLMRAYPFVTVNPGARFMAADPASERALRVAYGWASEHLPRSAVLQQNPTLRRAFAFGVYGRNPIGVADAFGSLYGADPEAVAARLATIGPIFKSSLPASEIGARAAANGIDDLIVTAADPVWSKPDSFVWRVKPIFASERVRIIPAVTLEASR